MYKHILLAYDGSENAMRAAKEAIKIASSSPESFIEVVYAVNIEKSKSEVLHAPSVEALEVMRRQKLSGVENLLKESDISYRVKILRGIPGPEIVKYANEQKVDLVVIGSRGLNALQQMVLGSVSHKVMKRVKCPALVVK